MGTQEKIVELTPVAGGSLVQPRVQPRVVGPGRRERGYLSRLTNLEERLSKEAEERRLIERELDVSQRLERGCQRLIDRIEDRWTEDRERLALAEGQQKRLILALGAVQRENELLRERLELGASRPEQLPEHGADSEPSGPTEPTEPREPQRPRGARRRTARPTARRGLFARLFGG